MLLPKSLATAPRRVLSAWVVRAEDPYFSKLQLSLEGFEQRMATDRLWCVRAGESGVFANDFRTGGYVAIGWNEVGKDAPVDDTAAMIKVMETVYPDKELGTLQVWAAQIRRFYREPQIGDGVVTYDPKTRTYHLGVIDSDVEWRDQPLARTREVTWTHHARRDDLSEPSRNSLGSIGTLFLVREDVAAELWAKAKSNTGDLMPEGSSATKLWSAAVRLAETYANRPPAISKDAEQFRLSKQMREAADELANQLVPSEHWLVRSSVGQGNWVRTPWLAILDKRLTTTAQEGWYFVLHAVGEGARRLRFGVGLSFTQYPTRSEEEAARIRSDIPAEWLDALRQRGFREQPTPELELPGVDGPWGMILARQVAIEEALEQVDELSRQLQLLLGAYKDWVDRHTDEAVTEPERTSGSLTVRERSPQYGAQPGPVVDQQWLTDQTLWTEDRLAELVEAIETRTPQIILAGPPGTGKTWVAEALATYLTRGRVGGYEIVQFHPSYSYEEFVEGLRPVPTSTGLEFRPVDGHLVRIVKALPDGLRKVLIVDEINRANLPKVFGELMYLLEYRGKRINLQYSSQFVLPKDLLLIGTMNTADRSIRSIDVALRRRFEIFECAPDAAILERFYASRQNEVGDLLSGFNKLNEALTKALDRHHTIGHTFFMAPVMTTARLQSVWKYRIGPLIEEYFFDQPDVAAGFVPSKFWEGL